MNDILMSIHSKWAKLIYSGEKTVELRKNAPKGILDEDAKIFLYETDLKCITGVIFVKWCHEITEISPKLVENSCVPFEEIEAYKAKGNGKLYAWEITGVDEYGPDWLQLEDIHAKRAPQSWQYVRL